MRSVIQSAPPQMNVRTFILLRFPEHAVTVSESIKGNLHQISLFPVDKQLCTSSGGTCKQLKSQVLLVDTCPWGHSMYSLLGNLHSASIDVTMLTKICLFLMVPLHSTLDFLSSCSPHGRKSSKKQAS